MGGRPWVFDHFLAGIVAGGVGTVVGFPMDIVKTQMQSLKTHDVAGTTQRILQRDGVLGLYRGIAAPLCALMVLNAQTFALYSWLKRQLKSAPLSGFLCGFASSLVSTPFELIKVRVAVGKSPNALRAFKDLGRNLYHGHQINTLRECVFLSSYFTVYEHSRRSWQTYLPASFLEVPCSGALAGATGWILSYPLDCVKTHVQKQSFNTPQPPWYTILRDTIRIKGGLHALYSGLAPSIARACLTSATRFTAYEAALSLIRRHLLF